MVWFASSQREPLFVTEQRDFWSRWALRRAWRGVWNRGGVAENGSLHAMKAKQQNKEMRKQWKERFQSSQSQTFFTGEKWTVVTAQFWVIVVFFFFTFPYSLSFPLGCYKRQLVGRCRWMGDTEAFYLTNCQRVVSENTVNGGKVGVCVRAREREREKKSHKLKQLSVFVSMATEHTAADLCIVITHYPQSNRLHSNLVYFSVASQKEKTDRHAVITVFLRRTEARHSITIIFHLDVVGVFFGQWIVCTLVGNNASVVFRDLYVRLNKLAVVHF